MANIWQQFMAWLRDDGNDARARQVVRDSTRRGLVGGRPMVAAGAWDYEYNLWGMVGRRTAAQPASLQMLRYIRDYNPDASKAIWDMLRMATAIKRVRAYAWQAGAYDRDAMQPDEEGTAMLYELDRRIGREYGQGLRAIAGVLALTAMTQGAEALEVALTKDLRDVLDFCPVDPQMIGFQRDGDRIAHPVLAGVAGTPVPLNELQFRYVPLDPDVDDPHGRSPFWPALEAVQFQTEVLRDLKAVAHNQGYPRIDVSVVEEIVLANVPAHLKTPGNEETLREWVSGYLTDLQTAYNDLKPDDTFIHWDWVNVGMAGPGKGGSGSIDFKALVTIIDSQIVSAVKSLPILLGRNEGATTTHATVQWQIYAKSVEAIQDILQLSLEWACNLALQVWGRQSVAEIEFERPRQGDRLADANAEAVETETRIRQRDAGWIDNNQAAQAMVGHPAVAEPAPPPASPEPEPPADDEGDEGDDAEPPAGEEARAAGDYHDEEAEWALTPAWMQAAARGYTREVQATTRRLWHIGAALDIPDEDWEAAVMADAPAGDDSRRNGHGRT